MIKTTSQIERNLVKLGLSEHESTAYLTLVKAGPLSSKELAKIMKVLPNALYRLLDSLIEKSLITATGNHPMIYKAITPKIAFDAFVKNQISGMEAIKEQILLNITTPPKSDQTRIDILGSINEFFHAYGEFASQVKKEICIISIGETVSEDTVLTNRDALERGISIRFIAHKYDKTNQDLLKRWVKMGLEVRHFSDWGFHLVVFDQKISLLSVNNPQHTNDRLSLVIYSTGLSKALHDYFESVWFKSCPVKE